MSNRKLEDLILLRAIYNEELSQAIFNKDIESVMNIVNNRYHDDLQHTTVFTIPDINKLYHEHIKDLEEIKNDPELAQRLL